MGDGDAGISELGDSALDLPSEPEEKNFPIDSQILLGSDSLALPSGMPSAAPTPYYPFLLVKIGCKGLRFLLILYFPSLLFLFFRRAEPAGIRSWFSSGECDALLGDSVFQHDVQGQEEDYIVNHFRRPNEQYKRVDDFLLFERNSKEIDKYMVFSDVAADDDAEAKENNDFVDNHLHDDEATQIEAAERSFSLENVLLRVKCEVGQNGCQRFCLIHPKDIVECGGSATEGYSVPWINDGEPRKKEGCNLKNVLASSKHEDDQKTTNGSLTGAFICPKSRDNNFTIEITNLVAEKKRCAVSAASSNRSEEKKGCDSKSRQGGYSTISKDQMAASRRPFSEISNIVPLKNLDRNVGKWQCPRKRKADLGPPMKQLRLEQWVRRSETKRIQHIR